MVIRFHQHSLLQSSSEFLNHLKKIYWERFDKYGYEVGGQSKYLSFRASEPGFELVEESPLQQLVASANRLGSIHYLVYVPTQNYEQYLPQPSTASDAKSGNSVMGPRRTFFENNISNQASRPLSLPVDPNTVVPGVLCNHNALTTLFDNCLGSDISNWDASLKLDHDAVAAFGVSKGESYGISRQMDVASSSDGNNKRSFSDDPDSSSTNLRLPKRSRSQAYSPPPHDTIQEDTEP